jgi:hypothetical protein
MDLTDWRPIDTAPRDGTFLLLFAASGDAVSAICPFQVARWTHDSWESEDSRLIERPTHWMPLPPPPAR